MAQESERRWLRSEPLSALDGVPVVIKDLVPVAGWPLTRGCAAFINDPMPPQDDAPAVCRLREAGCVLLGKTATSDHGCRPITRSAIHGVTKNPHDIRRTPGGSSGGSAAAVAAGLAPLALGTDGGGSIRIPAAWTGIVGLKPSFGRVPTYPPAITMPHSVAGPMARTVRDTLLMLDVLAKPDWRDPYALPIPWCYERSSPRELRVGISYDFGIAAPPIDGRIRAALKSIGKAISASVAVVDEVHIKWPTDPFYAFKTILECTYAGLLIPLGPQKVSQLDPVLREFVRRGSAVDIVSYQEAIARRGIIAAHAKRIFRDLDVLIGPTTLGDPPLIDDDAPPGFNAEDWPLWAPFCYVWNMTGQPAAAVPVDIDAGGLPQGIQVVGPPFGDLQVISAALLIEQSRTKSITPQI